MSESFPELLGYLEARRSVPALQMSGPGPSADELKQILKIAARVPDHGKIAPWRFIVVAGDAREELADKLGVLRRKAEPEVSEERLAKDRAVLLSSPLHVVVVSTAGSHVKVPEWEQVLSSGAVCLNMIHAAHALGYRAQWLSGWAAYDASARAVYGIGDGEKVAGFIHIGTNDQPQTDRDRPDVDALTSTWSATS